MAPVAPAFVLLLATAALGGGADARLTAPAASLPSTLPTCAAELLSLGVPLAFPSDAAFANATRVNDPLFNDRAPPFAALPRTEAQLAASLACAARAGARVALKGGGHSSGGYSSLADGGAFSVSLESLALAGGDNGSVSGGGGGGGGDARVAWAASPPAPPFTLRASGGARWSDVYAFLDAAAAAPGAPGAGRVAVGGLCPSVGLGGHVQGGGVGPLTRLRGLAADSLLDARLVLANGSGAAVASAAARPPLLAALRGGGGASWGVVTELLLATHASAEAYTYTRACFAAADAGAAEAFAALYAAAAPALPRELVADAFFSGGEACVWAIFSGDSAASAAALAPLTHAAAPAPRPSGLRSWSFARFWPMLQSYAAARGYAEFGDEPWSSRSCFAPAAAVARGAGFARALVAPFFGPGNVSAVCGLHLLHVGGAAGDVAPNATAFAWRDAALLPYAACAWKAGDRSGPAEARRGLDAFAASLADYGCGASAYVNFQDRALSGAEASRLNFGENLPFLLAVKAAYAPAGQTPLRFPQEVGAE